MIKATSPYLNLRPRTLARVIFERYQREYPYYSTKTLVFMACSAAGLI